jgi:hypothetical protein
MATGEYDRLQGIKAAMHLLERNPDSQPERPSTGTTFSRYQANLNILYPKRFNLATMIATLPFLITAAPAAEPGLGIYFQCPIYL